MIDPKKINYTKGAGLVPCIVQDVQTLKVLMLGYMNEDALRQTIKTKRVTFWSRSKERLWTKGETSGNFLNLHSIALDCDQDALLIKVNPVGPVCHKGTDTCWSEQNQVNVFQLEKLEKTILARKNQDTDDSYTASLFQKGINKIAQKVGEEAVELVIEAKDNDRELFLNEAADLMYHLTVLLAAKDTSWRDVMEVLRGREK